MTSLKRRARLAAVVALLLAGLACLIAGAQPWGIAHLVDGRVLTVTGTELAGALPMVAFVLVALGIALPITGRVWRIVLGALTVLASGAVMFATFAAVAEVPAALGSVVAEATGLAGEGQAAEVERTATSGWPALAAAGGVLGALAGLWIIVTGHRWPAKAARAKRYEREGSGLAWDALNDGDDPTRYDGGQGRSL